jgi:hypothetical protein
MQRTTGLVFFTVASLLSLARARAATILVPEDQPTIQACVDAAIAGDVCSLAPGVYHEDSLTPPNIGGVLAKVVVNKAVTIRSRELFQAVLDARNPSLGFAGFVLQANARLEGLVIKNVAYGAVSRGNLDSRPIAWSASNIIVTSALYGMGLDERGVAGELHASSGTFSNITVDARDTCYWTNDAASLTVTNSLALNCSVGFEGCSHTGFVFSYSLAYGVTTIRRESCSASLPSVGPGFVTADPLILHAVTATHDFPYFLRCASPAVDAGDPASSSNDALFPPSWGTSRNDMGAYGGSGAVASLTSTERQFLTGQTLALQPSGADTLLSWCGPPEATGFDLVRGELATLASTGGDFAAATGECLANDQLVGSLAYSGTPNPGTGFWFLVRCEGCPGKGTYDSGASSQTGSRDVEISASGHDCP